MIRRITTTQRAAVIPIAFVLFLGLLVLTTSMYQSNVVPIEGTDAEIDANRALYTDVRMLDFAVTKAIETGVPQPLVVGQYVEYETGLNVPKQPTHVIATTENESVRFQNAQCVSATCETKLDSRNLLILSNYQYLQTDRVYGYEYGVVYSSPRQSGESNKTVITHTEQPVINGTGINLVTFDNDFSVERAGTASAMISPNVGATRTYNITDNGDPMRLVLPTELSEEEWDELLASQMSSENGYLIDVTYQTYVMDVQEDRKKPGKAKQEHWEDCDHNGNGKPFVTCTIDSRSNYIVLTFEPGREYTVTVRDFSLG